MALKTVYCPRCGTSQISEVRAGKLILCNRCGKNYLPDEKHDSFQKVMLRNVFWVIVAGAALMIGFMLWPTEKPPAAKPLASDVRPAPTPAPAPKKYAQPITIAPSTAPSTQESTPTPSVVAIATPATAPATVPTVEYAVRLSADGVPFPNITTETLDPTKLTAHTKLTAIEAMLLHDPAAIGVKVFSMSKSASMLQRRTTFYTHQNSTVRTANAFGNVTNETRTDALAYHIGLRTEWFAVDLANADLAGIELRNGLIHRILLFYSHGEAANRLAQQSYPSGLTPRWRVIPLIGGAGVLEVAATPSELMGNAGIDVTSGSGTPAARMPEQVVSGSMSPSSVGNTAAATVAPSPIYVPAAVSSSAVTAMPAATASQAGTSSAVTSGGVMSSGSRSVTATPAATATPTRH